jgi:hypothetical protein
MILIKKFPQPKRHLTVVNLYMTANDHTLHKKIKHTHRGVLFLSQPFSATLSLNCAILFHESLAVEIFDYSTSPGN